MVQLCTAQNKLLGLSGRPKGIFTFNFNNFIPIYVSTTLELLSVLFI